MAAVDRVVLLHRVREVLAQVGFTRFEAAVPDIEGELELGVRRADLAREIMWLPAVENRGEDVFLAFKKPLIDQWLSDRREHAPLARGRLESGRLAEPFDLVALRRHVPARDCGPVKEYLAGLAACGFTVVQAPMLLRAVADEARGWPGGGRSRATRVDGPRLTR
jgi:hypothetical protein